MKIIPVVSKFVVVALAITAVQPVWAMDSESVEKIAIVESAAKFSAGKRGGFLSRFVASVTGKTPDTPPVKEANGDHQVPSNSAPSSAGSTKRVEEVLGKKGASSRVKEELKDMVRNWGGKSKRGAGAPAKPQKEQQSDSVLRQVNEGSIDEMANRFKEGGIPGYHLSKYILYPLLVLVVVGVCYALTKGVEAYKKRNQKDKSTDQVA